MSEVVVDVLQQSCVLLLETCIHDNAKAYKFSGLNYSTSGTLMLITSVINKHSEGVKVTVLMLVIIFFLATKYIALVWAGLNNPGDVVQKNPVQNTFMREKFDGISTDHMCSVRWNDSSSVIDKYKSNTVGDNGVGPVITRHASIHDCTCKNTKTPLFHNNWPKTVEFYQTSCMKVPEECAVDTNDMVFPVPIVIGGETHRDLVDAFLTSPTPRHVDACNTVTNFSADYGNLNTTKKEDKLKDFANMTCKDTQRGSDRLIKSNIKHVTNVSHVHVATVNCVDTNMLAHTATARVRNNTQRTHVISVLRMTGHGNAYDSRRVLGDLGCCQFTSIVLRLHRINDTCDVDRRSCQRDYFLQMHEANGARGIHGDVANDLRICCSCLLCSDKGTTTTAGK